MKLRNWYDDEPKWVQALIDQAAHFSICFLVAWGFSLLTLPKVAVVCTIGLYLIYELIQNVGDPDNDEVDMLLDIAFASLGALTGVQ